MLSRFSSFSSTACQHVDNGLGQGTSDNVEISPGCSHGLWRQILAISDGTLFKVYFRPHSEYARLCEPAPIASLFTVIENDAFDLRSSLARSGAVVDDLDARFILEADIPSVGAFSYMSFRFTNLNFAPGCSLSLNRIREL